MARAMGSAPPFDCDAVVRGSPARLTWKELHGGQWFVLLFEPLAVATEAEHGILADAECTLLGASVRTGVVVDAGLNDVLGAVHSSYGARWLPKLMLPLISDASGHIAALYGVVVENRRRLRGRFIIDPAGAIRREELTVLPLEPNLADDLAYIRQSQACAGRVPYGPPYGGSAC